MSVIENFFDSYIHIGLQELEDVALMDRSEKKYIIPIAWCGDISNKLSTDYNILEIANERQFRYDNLYFDTPENICLEDHIRGRKNRFKVRIRSYSNSNISFLEVKSRNVYGRSQKMPMIDSNKLLNQKPWRTLVTPLIKSCTGNTVRQLQTRKIICHGSGLTCSNLRALQIHRTWHFYRQNVLW